MGTPEFAVPALNALCGSVHDVALVVTAPDRPRNRGHKLTPTPVKVTAVQMGIPVIQPDNVKNDKAFFDAISTAAPDLIIVVAYGKILPVEILDIPQYGCVNIHASLLPKYRGAAPIHRAVEAGEESTGITLMYMSEGMDEGDIIATKSLDVRGMNSGRVTELLSHSGADLLMKTLPAIAAGTAHRIPQEKASSSYAPPVTKEDGKIDFTADQMTIVRKIRAMTPSPGAYCFINDNKMRVIEAIEKQADETTSGRLSPGDIIAISNDGIAVKTGGDGSVLITSIQMPGKKQTPVADYLRGNTIDEEWKLS